MAWLISRISSKPGNVELPGGFALTLPGDTVAVASLRYTGSLLLRADIFAQSEAQAKQIVDSANTHLALVRSIGDVMGKRGPDKDMKAAFDSIQVGAKENVAVFTATVPQSILKKIWSEVQAEGNRPRRPRANPDLHGSGSHLLVEAEAKIFVRIDRSIKDSDFVVQVRTGAASALSHVTHRITPAKSTAPRLLQILKDGRTRC